jgi:hypothetical protein
MNSHCLHSLTIVLHSQAFAYCTSLTSADLTGVASIRGYVANLYFPPFYACGPLERCRLCDGITTTPITEPCGVDEPTHDAC